MGGRLEGTRRVAGALEAGAQLLGDVTQEAGQIFFRDGTVGAPPAVYTNDTDTSAVPYRNAANRVDFVAGGVEVLSLRQALVHMYVAASTASVFTVNGSARYLGRFQRGGDVAPVLAAGDTNNLAVAGAVARVTPDGGGTSRIGGIVPELGDGDEVLVINLGAAALTIGHQVAGSTAGNRIICVTGADMILGADQAVYLWYDPVATRYRAFPLF